MCVVCLVSTRDFLDPPRTSSILLNQHNVILNIHRPRGAFPSSLSSREIATNTTATVYDGVKEQVHPHTFHDLQMQYK
jgi:hypothetical protein